MVEQTLAPAAVGDERFILKSAIIMAIVFAAGYFMSIEEEAASMNEQQVEELRDKLRKKLNRLRDRMIREEGWTLDEATDYVVPPSWIRDPEHVPKQGH